MGAFASEKKNVKKKQLLTIQWPREWPGAPLGAVASVHNPAPAD